MERHKAMTSHEHVFRQVTLSAYIPPRAAQPFKTDGRWWCNVCSQELTHAQAFFHCQACGTGSNGFDMVSNSYILIAFVPPTVYLPQCSSCSDAGGLFRHGAAPNHQFLHVSPVFVPRHSRALPAVRPHDAPPPYTPYTQ